jgi:hypothetical protein
MPRRRATPVTPISIRVDADTEARLRRLLTRFKCSQPKLLQKALIALEEQTTEEAA